RSSGKLRNAPSTTCSSKESASPHSFLREKPYANHDSKASGTAVLVTSAPISSSAHMVNCSIGSSEGRHTTMTDIAHSYQKARPAHADPPVGAVAETPARQTRSPRPSDKPTYSIPHDLECTQTKTMRMTRDHEELLNELKFRHGLKIQ